MTEPAAARPPAPCRLCGAPLELTLVDLGMSPLCESFVRPEQLDSMEPFYPLHVRVCTTCFLVQLEAFVAPAEIFEEYAYFSSYSTSWVEHARRYVEAIVPRLGLSGSSRVVEVASNDGYLLQHFLPLGVPVLGVDPAANVARAAVERGVPTVVDFFGVESARRLAGEGGRADLVVANNVVAQVPDLHDFLGGLAELLAPGGSVTLEFPHLLRLLEGLQYDTIYHEHFSYFSFETMVEALHRHGIEVYDVEELPTHGGSLRVFGAPAGAAREPAAAVAELLRREHDYGLRDAGTYSGFGERVRASKRALLDVLVRLKGAGAQLAGYGAPGKGNTLLNYCGIRTDFLDYTVDRSSYKQGLFLPGTHIPIHHPDRIAETRPDYVVVLPWNLLEEIRAQLAYIAGWGGRLIVPIPVAEIVAP